MTLTVLPGKHEHVVIRNLLLAVGKFEECLICLVKRLFVKVTPKHVQTMLESRTPGASREHDGILVDSHIFRVDNFVALAVFQHAVLMDAAGMGEGVAPDYRLVGLNGHIHQARHEFADSCDAGGVDVGVYAQLLMRTQRHDHLLKRSVTRALADTVDCHLRLACASAYAADGVGSGHTQVVVAVGGDSDVVDPVDMLHEIADLLLKLPGEAIPRGVGNIDHGRSRFHHSLYHTGEVFVVRSPCVFGVKLHILNE